MKNNLWSLGVHSNPKLLWILNYRIFKGQGNLGLELRSKGIQGFPNFKTELILPRHVRILGLELRSKGIQGVPQFQNRIDPSTSCENFRIRIEVQGVPQFQNRIGSPRDFIILWDPREFRIRIGDQGDPWGSSIS